ncbi:MAG: hypothetical protein V4805_03885 [Pseudomonadota bacterium]
MNNSCCAAAARAAGGAVIGNACAELSYKAPVLDAICWNPG